jgi:hypothetical protein
VKLTLHRRPTTRPAAGPPAWLDEPLRTSLPGGGTDTDRLRRLSACYSVKVDRLVGGGRLDLVAELSDSYLDEAWGLLSGDRVQN